ncbi:AsmA family protein [Aeromonas simiae]|uniref:AsmA family protein n=1 Tax=Aeromonas simiae TaxID=218936 RepID=UPI0005AA7906|nr:AsmA family protein [Aeromonas simiae]
MKKLLLIACGLIVAVMLGIATLILTIDPNQFKPLLASQVHKSTGRELVIEGPIGWTLWPRFGLTLERAALRNLPGFAEPDLLRVEGATASVAVLPLLSHRLEVGEVRLSGAHLLLQTRQDGSSNLDALGSTSAPPHTQSDTPAATTASPKPESANWQIDIEGITLEQASALLLDERSGQRLEIESLNLEIGALAPHSWLPITLELSGRDDAQRFTLQGSAELLPAAEPLASQLRNLELGGSLHSPALRLDAFRLKAAAFALDKASSLTLNAKGQQAERTFDLQLATTVTLGRALAGVTLQQSDLKGTLSGQGVPRTPLELGAMGDLQIAFTPFKLDAERLTLQAADLALSGRADVTLGTVPHLRFDLQGKTLNLDSWLGSAGAAPAKTTAPPIQNPAPVAAAGKPATSQGSGEPDLSALKGLELAGNLKLERLEHGTLVLSRPALTLALKGGVLDVQHFSAGVEQGTLQGSGRLDANPAQATYQLNGKANGLQVLPLLQRFAKTDLLSGRANLDLAVTGRGLSAQALRSAIEGKAALKIEDGALHGVNLPEMVREARATLKGQRADYVKESRKTDFSALTADFTLGGGKARSQNIQLFAPALRVHGSGETQLISEQLDFLFNTSVVGTSKGQGGRDIDALKDVTIPVRIGGNWSQPTYALDIKALLQGNKVLEDKARKEAERGLNKLLGDKADDPALKGAADKLLKGLFR